MIPLDEPRCFWANNVIQICKKQKKKAKKKKANKQTDAKKQEQKTKKTSKLAITTDLHSAVCKMEGSAGESKRDL